MPSSLAMHVQHAAGSLTSRLPARARPFAEPPPGSGLKPAMGDFGAPVIGHTFEALRDLVGYARARYELYGPVQWGGILGKRVVMLTGPEAIEVALVNRDKAFANKPGWEYFIGPFFHRGIMLMDFEEHHHHRRIMQAAFTRDRLIGYLDAMNPAIERGLSHWSPREGFQIYTRAKQLTLDIATEVFMGEELGPQADRLNKAFVDSVRGGQAIVRTNMPGGIWHRGLRGRRLLESYFRAQLPAKRAGAGDDLFSVLCHSVSEDGHQFSDDDIVNHMIFLMMAAHDTSTITLANMAYFLGKHPEWQDRVRAESQALGKKAISYDDLDRLTSLDLVMKEALRLYAPVGMVVRQTVKDTEVLGHYIPADSIVVVGLFPSQRLEEWWPNPDEFDPERFAEHRREDKVHRYAWAPFGGGAHKCIGMHFGGMEVKAIMHQLLLGYRWSVRPDYEMPLVYGTGPIPNDGLPIHLERL